MSGTWKSGSGWIGVQHEGIEGLAEIPGALAMRHVAAGVADRLGQQHVRRHVALRSSKICEHAADVGMLDAALEEASGLHHLVTGVMDGGGGVIHRAHERELIGVFRHARENFADLDAGDVGLDWPVRAANFGGRVRLHVPCVELRRPADQHQHDAVDIGGVVFRGTLRFHGQKSWKRKAECREGSGVEKIAAAQAVTELHGPVRVKAKHGRTPSWRG